ncbi:MAG: uncharacterized protein KVP18_003217 [Porospora cf. gigantea A]|uniref:uncharacterized protein n=1 Tax=Porospora cf. gigantea A TaxID=2853593 RepID=UPI003559D277|nr:MAG: hypothetical protein KVP18_003217 [Porospora cf. gigantea A]
MSGLVGFKKPQFALFGDTVNTASRMKLTGIVDHVHVSDDYRKVLQMENGMLNWLTREIQVKGKGSMTTHLLKSVQGMDYPQFNQGASDSNRTAKTVQDVLQSIRRDTVVMDREKDQRFAPDQTHGSSPSDPSPTRQLFGRASFRAEFERQQTMTPDISSESTQMQTTRLRSSLTDRKPPPPPPRAAMEMDSQQSTQMSRKSRTSKLSKLWRSVQSKTKLARKKGERVPIDISEERLAHQWAPDPVHRSSMSSMSSYTEQSNKYDLDVVINRMVS